MRVRELAIELDKLRDAAETPVPGWVSYLDSNGDDCGYSDPYRSVTILLNRRGTIQHVHH